MCKVAWTPMPREREDPHTRPTSWIVPIFFLSGILFALSNCAPLPQRPAISVKPAIAEQLLATLGQKESAILSLKGLLRIHIQGDGVPISRRMDGVLLYRRPRLIRLKGFSPLGGLVFDFLVNRDHYTLHIPKEGQVFTGKVGDLEATGEIGVLVKLSLQAMDTLLGKVGNVDQGQLYVVEDGDQYRIEVWPSSAEDDLADEDIIRRIWVGRNPFQVSQLEHLSSDGEIIVVVQAEDFRPVRKPSPLENSTIMLPFRVVAEDRLGEKSVSLKFQEIIANAPLEAKEFGLTKF